MEEGLQRKQSSDGAEEERGLCFAFFYVGVREKLQPSVLLDAAFMYSTTVKLSAAVVIQALFFPSHYPA